MLRDRFSANSTPSGSPPPHSRNYSPTPRTSSRLAAPSQRPAVSRQPSIISLVSGSQTSLPGTVRVPDGSPLKRSIEAPDNIPDPLKVLQSVLGESESVKNGEAADNGRAGHSTADLEWMIDFGELSLQEFGNSDVGQRKSPSEFSTLPSVQLYPEVRQKYEEFHDSISSCNAVLRSVESYLSNFQDDLGAVSAEIETLQSKSVQLNARLENRRKVESLLGPAIEEISISPMTVRTIAEGPVDEDWIKSLRELETRSDQVAKKSARGPSERALEDLRPLLKDLEAKATERIRDFFVLQIKAIRSPNINAQVIQRGTLIKYKELYVFLSRNHKVLADEISQAYVNTMKWYYANHFTRYYEGLEKLKLHVLDHGDFLGADPTNQRKSTNPGTTAHGPNHNPFDVGRRADILRPTAVSAMPSHITEEFKTLTYIEVPFHNFNLAVIDNITSEYIIAAELFAGTRSFHAITRLVDDIFSPTFSLGLSLTKALINSSTDCLGVLLCVRLNQRSAFTLQRRKSPVAEAYINGNTMLLWPRFQQILDLHADSLKRAATTLTRFNANTALSLVGGSDSSKSSVAPHFVSQRFGQLLHGLLVVSAEAGDDEPVSNSLGRLRSEYEALMLKLSKNVGEAKRRARFLFNNYSLVLAIIGDCHGNLAKKQKENFEEYLEKERDKKY